MPLMNNGTTSACAYLVAVSGQDCIARTMATRTLVHGVTLAPKGQTLYANAASTVKGMGGLMGKLVIVPCHLDEANSFVAQFHRHHKPVPGAKFSLAVADSEKVRGVAIISRPTARLSDDGWT